MRVLKPDDVYFADRQLVLRILRRAVADLLETISMTAEDDCWSPYRLALESVEGFRRIGDLLDDELERIDARRWPIPVRGRKS